MCKNKAIFTQRNCIISFLKAQCDVIISMERVETFELKQGTELSQMFAI